jgi:hypothetical protein
MPTKKVKIRDQQPAKDPKGGKHKHTPKGGSASSGDAGDIIPTQVPGNPPIHVR